MRYKGGGEWRRWQGGLRKKAKRIPARLVFFSNSGPPPIKKIDRTQSTQTPAIKKNEEAVHPNAGLPT
jgi:hypothetical protein